MNAELSSYRSAVSESHRSLLVTTTALHPVTRLATAFQAGGHFWAEPGHADDERKRSPFRSPIG